jgi:hypothetical protein
VIALSSRHARWLFLLLAAALLPLLLEQVRPRRHDDCRHPDMLTLTLAIPGSKPTRSTARRARAEGGGASRGDFTLWTQGEIESPEDAQEALRFWMIRSFDPDAISPRAVLQGEFDPESHEVREIETEQGRLPVHVAIDRTRQPNRLVAWAFAYAGRPVAEVFPALLEAAPARLLRGSVPVTLFLVDAAAHEAAAGAVDAAATQWIAEAWSHMARYCR